MDYTHSITYQAPADAVFAMLSDPEYRRKACEHAGALEYDVRLEPRGEGFSLEIDQVQPTDHLPSLAKRFAGKTTRAVQREEWSDQRNGTFEVEAPGKPSEVKGTVTLTEEGGVTTQTFALTMTMNIPALGPRLEKMLGEQFDMGFAAEAESGHAWLAERG